MKSIISAVILTLIAFASAVAVETPEMSAVRRDVLLLERAGTNDGRPVANGACCIANTSKKEDVCTVNGQQGKCVPADTANCEFILPLRLDLLLMSVTPLGGAALTCIENSKLTCNANVLENGKPTCRLAA